MLVSWPFVMLLLDYWPLATARHQPLSPRSQLFAENRLPIGIFQSCLIRVQSVATFLALLLEKIPFFALAIVASVVALVVQKSGGAVMRLRTSHSPRAAGTP